VTGLKKNQPVSEGGRAGTKLQGKGHKVRRRREGKNSNVSLVVKLKRGPLVVARSEKTSLNEVNK